MQPVWSIIVQFEHILLMERSKALSEYTQLHKREDS
jgi:hypothetical protein